MDGAAQESNLPTDGLHRLAGFEDGRDLVLEGRLRVVSDHLSNRRSQSHCADALPDGPASYTHRVAACAKCGQDNPRASGFAERAALR
jgi:hypothetical protein